MAASPRISMPNDAGWPYEAIDALCSTVSRGTAPLYVEHSDVMAIGQRCVALSGFEPSAGRPHSADAMEGTLSPEPGDVLLNSTGTGTIGRSCVFEHPGRFIVDGHITLLRPRTRADGRWLNSVLRTWWGQNFLETQCYSGSTNQVELSRTCLAAAELPTPPAAEQRRIAEILDTLDAAIRKTEQLIAKLKQVKQGLLHDLLTHGIDDDGRLRDPERRPEQFNETALGLLPVSWRVGSLLDVGATDRQPILTGPFGAQLGSSDFRNAGIPILRIGNVQWGYLDLDELMHVSEEKAERLTRYRVRPGDLLFARQGATTGRNALADGRTDGFLINYHIIRVATDLSRCHPTFLYSVFNSPVIQQQVDREKGRSTREGVSTSTLTSLLLPLPPIGEQIRFAGIVEAHDARAQREEAAVSKLRLLKHGLMEDLLTGRVRVTNLLGEAAA
jgi:type I restriction enzyme, S subunit